MATKKHTGNCPMCGTWRERLQRDHIAPKHKARQLGWSERQVHAATNIQYICANCHEDKTRIELSALPSRSKGKVVGAESRRKMSEAAKGNTRARGNKGRVHTEEERRKKSAALIGNTRGFKKGGIPWNKKTDTRLRIA